MNKEWKIRIILVLVTAIIFTGFGIYAETKISADKVSYSDKETVKDKIDSLYTIQNNTITNLENQNDSLSNQIDTLTQQLGNVTGGVSGEVNLTTSFTDIPLGFKPNKVIIASQKTNSNWTTVIVKDDTNNIDFSCYSNMLGGNESTKNISIACNPNSSYFIEFTDNGFKVRVGADVTSGKYYYYVIK